MGKDFGLKGVKVYAFTLIELLIVISIIAILAGLLFPALKKAKDVAQEVVCKSNQKQIATAIFEYTNDNNGYFPKIYSYAEYTSGPG